MRDIKTGLIPNIREVRAIELRAKGVPDFEIALKFGMSRNAVKQARYRGKIKVRRLAAMIEN